MEPSDRTPALVPLDRPLPMLDQALRHEDRRAAAERA
jgi:hypothetical protein